MNKDEEIKEEFNIDAEKFPQIFKYGLNFINNENNDF